MAAMFTMMNNARAAGRARGPGDRRARLSGGSRLRARARPGAAPEWRRGAPGADRRAPRRAPHADDDEDPDRGDAGARLHGRRRARSRRARARSGGARRAAEGRLALLTPLVKAWCTDLGFEIASTALQVHGGMGYIEETGRRPASARCAHRDDLRGHQRHPGARSGRAQAARWPTGACPASCSRSCAAISRRSRPPGETDLRRRSAAALGALEQATSWLQAEHDNDPDAAAAGATPYLRLFATTLGGFLLARSALAAARGSDARREQARERRVLRRPAAAAGHGAAARGHRRLRAACRGGVRLDRSRARALPSPARGSDVGVAGDHHEIVGDMAPTDDGSPTRMPDPIPSPATQAFPVTTPSARYATASCASLRAFRQLL